MNFDGDPLCKGREPCQARFVYQRWRGLSSAPYRGPCTAEEMYGKTSDTLTLLTTGGKRYE